VDVKAVYGDRESLLPVLKHINRGLKDPLEFKDQIAKNLGYPATYLMAVKKLYGSDPDGHVAVVDDIWVLTKNLLRIEASTWVSPEVFFANYLLVQMEYWQISEEELEDESP